jgi:hypothetical protein
MNTRHCLFAITLGAVTLPAQDQLNINYGTQEWGGRMTLASHASFSNASTTFLPDFRADLGSSFDNHVRIAGDDYEAFYAQGDLDARLAVGFRYVNGRLTQTVTEGVTVAGLVRIAGNTIARTVSVEATQDLLIPLASFTQGGDVEFNVPLGLGFALVVGVGGTADVRAVLVPAVAPNPFTASLAVTVLGHAEGHARVAVGIPGAAEVGVRGSLDYADPSASAILETDFETITPRLCWTYGRIVLALDAFARVNVPFLGWMGLTQNIVTLSSPAVTAQCITF